MGDTERRRNLKPISIAQEFFRIPQPQDAQTFHQPTALAR
jgi:hypothetical protein